MRGLLLFFWRAANNSSRDVQFIDYRMKQNRRMAMIIRSNPRGPKSIRPSYARAPVRPLPPRSSSCFPIRRHMPRASA
ncbi:hypothetical protein OUZ56_030111 [Daphnia magna]|uniref:Uncharacterized protein n=1 Tax=Daphnia magna TaxID=35525 RepID=A0ABQ9ZQC0_9CRUS|nr:hypothetical protein OUZ56_030111 [Daphnia magna]